MRLYLSSYGLGDHAATLKGMVETKKVLFIENAKDYLPASDRAAHIAKKRHEFHELGFEFAELDLRQYFHQAHDFSKELDGVGLVWLSGGNTFILRRALKQSGFDAVLQTEVAAGRIVYGGSSAGAIVATPSLKGAEPGDDPHDIPSGYHDRVVWSGLGLVPFHIVPHYESTYSDEAKIAADAMVAYLKRHELSYHTLKDGEVYIVKGVHQEHLR